MKKIFSGAAMAAALITLGCSTGVTRPTTDPRGAEATDPRIINEAGDPGCAATTLVSTGGPFPRDPATLAVRWTGYANFELVYNGQILLLDTYFDRGAMFPPLGFKAAEVKRADVILLGHGHVDHMSDAASVGAQTGAIVVGAPVTTEKLLTQTIDPKQVRTVTGRGGEVLQFKGFKVEPILGRHGEPESAVVDAFEHALKATTKPATPAEAAERAAIRARGTSDKRVVAEGTLAFLITLDNGFRILFRDSGGIVTDYEKAAMARVGRVDLALVAVSAAFLNTLTVQRALEHLRAYKPDVYMPAHHDGPYNNLWRPTEPLFQAMKDENPQLVTVSRNYREPVCFNTGYNIERATRGAAR
jgi:L-ascorbate metabolism protein UlaG (beta-lactamase superfamily)